MRRRITRRNLRSPECHQMAPLVRIAAHLRAILAAHVAFKPMDRRGFRTPPDIECDGPTGVAAKAADFERKRARVERVAERGRWLRRSLEGQHALRPCLAGEPVG